MKEFIKKYKILIIFGIFFLLVLFQHHFLHLYHDDYGYASLSYAYQLEGTTGHSNNLIQIFQFLIGHYKVWGGRILFFFIECTLLNLSFPLFKVVQSIVITLIFYFIYKIVYSIAKKNQTSIALLSCCCYGFIQLETVKSGIFWVSASVLYVFPMLFMLMFVYFQNIKITNKKKNIIKCILLCIAIFFATFSQEQIAIAMLVYILGIIIYEFISTKKIDKKNILYLLSSVCGFIILMMSPGNVHRMEKDPFYSLNLFEKLKHSIPDILSNIYGKYDRIIIFLLFIVSIFSVYKLLSNKKYNFSRILKTSLYFILVSDIVMLLVSLFECEGYYNNMVFFSGHQTLAILIMTIQTVLLFLPIFIYLYHKNQITLAILLLAAVCSQGAMIFTSYYPLRSMLIFNFIFFIIFVDCFFDATSKIDISRSIILTSLIIVSLFNYYYITHGFYTNYEINIQNDIKLTNASKKIKKGKKINKLTLQKLENDWFAGQMPYQENFEYITPWIKKYYELPSDLEIEYK